MIAHRNDSVSPVIPCAVLATVFLVIKKKKMGKECLSFKVILKTYL